MSRSLSLRARSWIGPTLLLLIVALIGIGLAAWKAEALDKANSASANQPEPTEVVSAAVATERLHRRTTTAIGTVLALQSVTLRNELAGTVRRASLTPGQIVEPGTVLVALDVSVEAADLKAQQADADLAETTLKRMQQLIAHNAVSQEEVDQARAERDVALAQVARTRAIIQRKIIRAPFRARVGLADLHPGQYLESGTSLTTLQSVEQAAHVDFTVAQRVAANLRPGDSVGVIGGNDSTPLQARIVAIDARVDPSTRNALVRARLAGTGTRLSPGASVRVLVPEGPSGSAVVVPVSALRKGPSGEHVFVIEPDKDGKPRAHLRQVESGPVEEDEVLILSGLSAGERIATSGSFKLREAVLVAVADSARPAGGGEGAK